MNERVERLSADLIAALQEVLERHQVDAQGHLPLRTQVFFPEDPYLENDTIGAVKAALVRPLTRHEDAGARAERGLEEPFYTCEFDIKLSPAPGA